MDMLVRMGSRVEKQMLQRVGGYRGAPPPYRSLHVERDAEPVDPQQHPPDLPRHLDEPPAREPERRDVDRPLQASSVFTNPNQLVAG